MLHLRERPLTVEAVFAPRRLGTCADEYFPFKLFFPCGKERVADVLRNRWIALDEQGFGLRRRRYLAYKALDVHRDALLLLHRAEAAAEGAAAHQRRADVGARALARYLDEAEPRHAVDARLAAVVFEKLLKLLNERLVVALVLHCL